MSYLKTPENVIVGAGVSYLCKITTCRAPAASQITCASSVVCLFPPQNSRKCRCGVLVVCSIHAHVQHLMHLRQSGLHVFSFDFPCPTSRFGKMKLWVVVQVVKFNLFSSTLLTSYLKTPENVIVGAGVSYLCKITTSRAGTASQITFSSSVVFLFPPQNSRKCRCGVLVVCSIHAHVQHLMHLRQSDLHVFSFYFPCPTSRFGKMKLWVVVYVVKFNLFSCTLFISYLKTPENVIVGAGVSYLCKITTSRAPAASQITFSSSVVFLFPPQNSRKCRYGVLVVSSIHAHVQHLMHLRQSDLHVFSFDFPCPTSRFGKTKLWVVVSRL